MEKDFGSWFQHQLSDGQIPHLNTLSDPFNQGQQNTFSNSLSPYANMVSSIGTQGFGFNGFPHSKVSPPNEPHGWFYCLPHFRQTFTTMPNSAFKEIPGPPENHQEVVAPKLSSGCSQKRFLVFDQSGDQTTLLYSSGTGNPVQCLTSWGPKPDSAHDLSKMKLETERNSLHCLEPILTDEYNENHGNDIESEMHEDTEELNALLYSDDDYYSEDDEVASTGHSPSTMTGYDRQDLPECEEEVASSSGPTKRLKLFDGSYNLPSHLDTASSGKTEKCLGYEDDAKSTCAGGENQDLREFESLSGNKRLRKEKIQETVSVLQGMIPGAGSTNAIGILDEAINYLRALKHTVEDLQVDDTL